MNNTETAYRFSCPSILIYSLFTIHSSLRRCQAPFLERITGIEPASSAWEAGVLPINYIRIEYILSSFPDFVNTVFEKILQSLSDKML